jgi:hypothetical protein
LNYSGTNNQQQNQNRNQDGNTFSGTGLIREIKITTPPLAQAGSQRIQMQWILLLLPGKPPLMLERNNITRKDNVSSAASKAI